MDKTEPLITKFLDEGWTCNVQGFIDIPKVKGNVHFQTERMAKAYEAFLKKNTKEWTSLPKDNKYKLQLNHKINKLTFGNEYM